MKSESPSLRFPIIVSVLFHLAIFSLFFIKFPHHKHKPHNEVKIINAVAINESALPSTSSTQTLGSAIKPLPQTMIRQIEQTTLKQPDLPTQPILKPLPAKPELAAPPLPPKKELKPEPAKPEPPKIAEKLQEPKIDEQALALEAQKVVEQKKKQEQAQKESAKQKEAQLAKKRREEAAKQLEQALDSEAKSMTAAKTENEKDQGEPTQSAEQSSKDSPAKGSKEESSSAAASNTAGEIDKYKQMIVQSISRKWVIPDADDSDLACQLLVHVGPGGIVLSVDILTESGNETLDRSARNAIMKASPLPVPQDSELFDNFRALRLTFRPQGIISG